MLIDSDFLIRSFIATQKFACVLPTMFIRLDREPEHIETAVRDRVMAGPSTIRNAGRGLFCRKAIRKGEIISQVKGRKHSLASCYFFVKNFSHVFTLSPWFLLVPDGDDVVQLANHNFDEAAINANFVRDPSEGSVKLVALRDIRAGEEVFVKYHERHLRSQEWARAILEEKSRPYAT